MSVDDIVTRDSILQANGIGRVTEAAINKRQHAAELRAWSGRLKGVTYKDAHSKADLLDAEADTLSDALGCNTVAMGTGGEMFSDPSGPRCFSDTMRDRPDAVAVDASRHRLALAQAAGVAALALDAAETTQAANSLEKMLAHQCAAAHAIAMQLQAEASALLTDFRKSDRRNSILTTEAARLINVSGRMMETTQRGVMAMHRLRHHGKQTMIVQHVHINDGGQAVVAGQLKGRGQGKRTA